MKRAKALAHAIGGKLLSAKPPNPVQTAAFKAQQNPHVLVFGHSHVNSMRTAAEQHGVPSGAKVTHIPLHAEKERYSDPRTNTPPKLLHYLVQKEGLTPAPNLWVSRIGGNEHNMLSLLEHNQPMDFILPGHEDLGIFEGAQIVTHGFLKQVLKSRIQLQLQHLPDIVAQSPVPMIHLETPPPLGDEDHLRANLGVFRKWVNGEARISNKTFRWKVWRLQSEITQEICAGLGISFVANPDSVFDDDGMLRRDLYGNDPTHGNALYGQIMNDLVVAIARGEVDANL